MIKKYFALSVIAASVAIAGCSDDDDDPETPVDPPVVVPPAPPATPGVGATVYDTIFRSEAHSTLLAAIDSVEGLNDTLDNPDSGGFTIFAPTNDAFNDFLAADPDDAFTETADFLAPENQAALVNILNYHVVSGTVSSTDIVNLLGDDDTTNDSANTLLSGGTLGFAATTTDPAATSGYDVVDSTDTAVALNTDSIDLGLSTPPTGVTHSIDTVLTPPAVETPDPVDPPVDPVADGAADTALATAGSYEIARAAITASFAGSLDSNAWTFFLPSDTILDEAGITELTPAQLQEHIASSGAIDPIALAALETVSSSTNTVYPVANENGITTVNGFEVNLLTDVTAASAAGAQIYSISGILTAPAE